MVPVCIHLLYRKRPILPCVILQHLFLQRPIVVQIIDILITLRQLSYLSAQATKSGKNEFDIPFDRQQLADYLCVDRSAMSAQLCALRDDGVLEFKKNHFILLR